MVEIFIFCTDPRADSFLCKSLSEIAKFAHRVRVRLICECSSNDLVYLFSFVEMVVVRNMSLGAKKTLAIDLFDSDYALLIHPRIILNEKVIDSISDVHGIFTPRVLREDGSRYLDLMHVRPVSFGPFSKEILIPDQYCGDGYIEGPSDYHYVDGGFIGISREVKLSNICFDPNLDWNNSEDVDFCKRAHKKGVAISLLDSSVYSQSSRYPRRLAVVDWLLERFLPINVLVILKFLMR